MLDDDHLGGLRAESDDVALADAVARNVDALAVDLDQAVVDELAGLRASGRPAGAERDVVETLLEQTQQVLARRAAEADGLYVGALELALEEPVDVLRLLLLLQLGEVLGGVAAAAGAAVGARRERPALEGAAALLVLEQVRAEAPRASGPWDQCDEP